MRHLGRLQTEWGESAWELSHHTNVWFLQVVAENSVSYTGTARQSDFTCDGDELRKCTSLHPPVPSPPVPPFLFNSWSKLFFPEEHICSCKVNSFPDTEQWRLFERCIKMTFLVHAPAHEVLHWKLMAPSQNWRPILASKWGLLITVKKNKRQFQRHKVITFLQRRNSYM